MSAAGGIPPDTNGLGDALVAAQLCAIDPGLGGMMLRGGGELRDQVIAALRAALPENAPVRRVPVHVDHQRLLGGVDLAAALGQGIVVRQRGLLAEARNGVVVVPMAERLTDALMGQLTGALDARECPIIVIALDDGVEDEKPPEKVGDFLAFWIDLSECSAGPAGRNAGRTERNEGLAEEPFADVAEALAATTIALGIDSIRAPLLALRAARAAARLAGRDYICAVDVTLAARLVLAPRATRLPAEAPQGDAPPPPENNEGDVEQAEAEPLDDIVLAAALAALPKDLLARIAAGRGRGRARTNGAGERRSSAMRGRPLGARAGVPRGGLRLSLIDTLRSAAPWQRLRGREPDGSQRVQIRRDDLRIRRFETRAQALTIFAVDASGSSAIARLAEAKGAVELLLAEAYVKRAEVALIGFRGTAAELLLPPTRSLARARRSLGELPGGGGTPLAAGLHAARELSEQARARGRTPFIVVMTDGRANVAADGRTVRVEAEADAATAARAIGAAGIGAVFVDISARPRPEGAALAAAMRARYLPLPRADAATMHAAVRAAQPQ